MEKAIAFILCLGLPFLASCSEPTAPVVTEIRNGAYKIVINSQGFSDSGIVNVDVCVVDAAAKKLPSDRMQCIFHGFDFNGISAKWVSDEAVEISFNCGRLTQFSNTVQIPVGDGTYREFYARLNDTCKTS